MTRKEFDALIDKAEKMSGQTFSKEWRDSRFEAAKSVTAQSFEDNMLPTVITKRGLIEVTPDQANN